MKTLFELVGQADVTLFGAMAQQQDTQLFLGEDFLPWMVLAFGAAMVVGPLYALVRPPRPPEGGEPRSAPLGRTVGMIVVGSIAAVWGLASLLS